MKPAKSKPTIRRRILCLLTGGLLLLTLPGCEALEVPFDPPAQETMADSTPTLAEIGTLTIEEIKVTLPENDSTFTFTDDASIRTITETMQLVETKATREDDAPAYSATTVELSAPGYESLTVSLWKDYDYVRVDAKPHGASENQSKWYRLFYLDNQILRDTLYEIAGVSLNGTSAFDDLLSEPISAISTMWGDTPINDPAAILRIARSLESMELKEIESPGGCVVTSLCSITFESGASVNIYDWGDVLQIKRNFADGTGESKYYYTDSETLFSDLLENYSNPRYYTPSIDFDAALSLSEYLQLPIEQISCKISAQESGTRHFYNREEILIAEAILANLQLVEIDDIDLLTGGAAIEIEFTDFSLQLQFDPSGYMQLSLYDYQGTLQRSQWYTLPKADAESIAKWVEEAFDLSIA